MEFYDTPVGELIEILICPTDDGTFGADFIEPLESKLVYTKSLEEFILVIGEKHWVIRGESPRHQVLLWEIATTEKPYIAWVRNADVHQKLARNLLLSIRRFELERSLSEEKIFDFPLREAHFDTIRKTILQRPQASNSEIIAWLKEHTILKSTGKEMLLISAGKQGFDHKGSNSFRILGHLVAINVEQTDDIYQVKRVVSFRGTHDTDPVIVLTGQFNFIDASIEAKVNQTSMPELDRIVSTAGSYLGIWDEYNKLERNILIKKARTFGWITYQDVNLLPNGWRLITDPKDASKLGQVETLEETDFEISAGLPHELEPEFPVDEEEDEEGNVSTQEPLGMGVRLMGINTVNGWLDVAPLEHEDDSPPPKKGYFFASLSGDRVRLKRRRYAWQSIRQSNNPIPMLGLLIERSESFESRFYTPVRLDVKELRKSFGGEPTPKQKTAIEIALNTPDIALIQGPPGTGKTRVITALNKILSGDRLKSSYVSGHILLTSYQHDAVENAANRSSVFGLPALKIGRRRATDLIKDQAQSWSERMVRELQSDPNRTTDTPLFVAVKRVHAHLLGYVRSPGTVYNTVRMLRNIYSDTVNFIPNEIGESLLALSSKLETSYSFSQSRMEGEKELLERSIRGLRTTQAAFSDDGPDTAYYLLKRTGDAKLLSLEEKNLLQQAADWENSLPPDFLPDLVALQNRLLEQLTTPVIMDQANLVNTEVDSILSAVDYYLLQALNQDYKNPETVVEQFIFDLENDPTAVRDTLWHYTAVLAATCQQAVGNKMLFAKNIDIDAEQKVALEFENVIIDEAARSNPLDLLIPMALARRRIILVGDHRQLPHMLETQVERGLERSGDAAKEALGKSLFERLFKFLQERQNIDGICRTVTLDQQYRMHPELGRFVSRVFYERHDKNEAFGSDAVLAQEFAHNLDGYKDKIAAWIEIPSNYGFEEGGQSKFRRSEARCITKEVAKILDHSDLSVGVISFYRQQTKEILKEMRKHGLADDVGGELQVHPRWLQNDVERLRVGTVDAFQGMEFDVVLLSMVRSNSYESVEGNEYSYRRKYGFLTLENRLCVAMSRQKRLLIIAGDPDMIHNPSARTAVPALVAFYHDLCLGPYGLVHRI